MKRYLRIVVVFGGIMAASTFWGVVSASEPAVEATCYWTPSGWMCF